MRWGRGIGGVAALLLVAVGALLGAAPSYAATHTETIVRNPAGGYQFDHPQVSARPGDTLQITDQGPIIQSVTVTLQGTDQKCQSFGRGQKCTLSLAGLSGRYQLTAADTLGDHFTPATVTVSGSVRPTRSPNASSTPGPHPTTTSPRGPAVAPAPSASASRTSPPPTAFAVPTFAGLLPSGQAKPGNGLAPNVAPSYLPPLPTATSSPTPSAVFAGPRPPTRSTDRQLGLPASLAAVLLVGLVAGFFRAARAGAVDELRRLPGPWRTLTRTSS